VYWINLAEDWDRFEGGDETWASLKSGEFLEHLRNCQLLQKDSIP
jgi:hypothetical protein